MTKPVVPRLDLNSIQPDENGIYSRRKFSHYDRGGSNSDPELMRKHSPRLRTPPRPGNYSPLRLNHGSKNPSPRDDDSPSRLYSKNSAPDGLFDREITPTPRNSISARVTFSLNEERESPSVKQSFFSRILSPRKEKSADLSNSTPNKHSDAVIRNEEESEEEIPEPLAPTRAVPEEETPATDEEVDWVREAVKILEKEPLIYGREDKLKDAWIRKMQAKRFEKISGYQSDLYVKWALGGFTKRRTADRKIDDKELITALANRRIKDLAKVSKKFFDEYKKCEEILPKKEIYQCRNKPKHERVVILQSKVREVIEQQDLLIEGLMKTFLDDAKAYYEVVDRLQGRHQPSFIDRIRGTSSAPDLDEPVLHPAPTRKSGTPDERSFSPREKDELLRVYKIYMKIDRDREQPT